MNKKKLRRKIAQQVEDKCFYMRICPNERDTIVNIILSKKDRYQWNIHCNKDCHHTTCESYMFKNKEVSKGEKPNESRS